MIDLLSQIVCLVLSRLVFLGCPRLHSVSLSLVLVGLAVVRIALGRLASVKVANCTITQQSATCNNNNNNHYCYRMAEKECLYGSTHSRADR